MAWDGRGLTLTVAGYSIWQGRGLQMGTGQGKARGRGNGATWSLGREAFCLLVGHAAVQEVETAHVPAVALVGMQNLIHRLVAPQRLLHHIAILPGKSLQAYAGL